LIAWNFRCRFGYFARKIDDVNPMLRSPGFSLLVCVIAVLHPISAQSPPSAQRAERPTPPIRNSDNPGYVKAEELPDGTNPPVDADGNFIIGPTHDVSPGMATPIQHKEESIPRGTVIEFTMNSSDSKIYPGIARDPNTFGTPDSANPAKLVVTTSHPAPYMRRVTVYVPKQYVPGSVAPFIVGADGPDPLLFSSLDASERPGNLTVTLRLWLCL
jgi:iron(III)-enterobactin esterase